MIIGKERVKNSYYIVSSYLDRKIENKSVNPSPRPILCIEILKAGVAKISNAVNL